MELRLPSKIWRRKKKQPTITTDICAPLPILRTCGAARSREKEELRLFAVSRVLEDLLPVMDNLALGLTAAKQPNADLKTLTGGVDMVLNQLKSALASHGLKEINPVGLPFDPHAHEAISHQPSTEVKPEHVLNVVRTGFSLNGRLLRPASVVVSSGTTKQDSHSSS